ncbi:MAG: adenylyltransferase/cytidyltransferase family protein [Bacteriovoracaceae bacterium]|nr:adenylyltransferase/cytidyltransferase family protein [Bacteriovoracaceae bacterium]
MRPNQFWLDLSKGTLRVWIDEKLQLAQAKGNVSQRVGFYRDTPLFYLPEASAKPMGWISYSWEDLQGKFNLEKDFWMGLEAARLTYINERPEKFLAPLSLEFPLASDVVFFGGTFDPWHQGHRACLEKVPQNLPLIICPDRNPQKPLKRDEDVFTFFNQLKTQIQKSGREKLHIHPGFLLQTELNPTVRWVLRLKHHRPDLRVHLLMGHDSFKSLPTWIQAADLMKLISGLMVVSRLEEDSQHAIDSKWALDQNPNLEIKFMGHHDFEDISSTNLRK